MRGRSICILLIMGMLLMSGLAQAQLTVIGTATYEGTDYNLIWDDDNNDNSVVWLDFSNARANWQIQKDWAEALDGQLTYNIDPAYIVTWSDAEWRLPNTVDGIREFSCDGTETLLTATRGYYFTNSEMGHLYYTELGNPGYRYMSGGSCQTNLDYGLQNTGPFQNLIVSNYWSGTEYSDDPPHAWYFYFEDGSQDRGDTAANYNGYGLALRSGQVVNGSIPTLSEWGQILLVVILGVSALWIKRRQSMMV